MKLFIILFALSCLIALVRAGSTNNVRNSPTDSKRNHIVESDKIPWKTNNYQGNEKGKVRKRKTKNSKKQKRKIRKSPLRGKRKDKIRKAKNSKQKKKENLKRKKSEKSTKGRAVKGTKRKVKDPNQTQKQKGKRRKTSKIKKTGILTKQKRKTNRSEQRKRKYNEKRNQSYQDKRLEEIKRNTRNMKQSKRKANNKGKKLKKKLKRMRQNEKKSKTNENSRKSNEKHPTKSKIKANKKRNKIQLNLKKFKLKKKSGKRKMSNNARQLTLNNEEEQIFIRTLRNRVRRWFNWGVRQYERSLGRMRSMRNKADNKFQFFETHSLLFQAVGESALMCPNIPYRDANKQIMQHDLTTLDQCRQKLELNCPTLTFPTGWEDDGDCTKINDNFIKVHDRQVDQVVDNSISTRQYINEITKLDTKWSENDNSLQTTCSSITQFTRDIRSQASECVDTNTQCKDTAVRAGRHIFNCRNTCKKTMQEIIIQNINIDVTNTGNCINNLYCFGGECEQVQFQANGVSSSNQDNCNTNRRQTITLDNDGVCINNVFCFGGGCDQSQFESNGDNSANTNNCNEVTIVADKKALSKSYGDCGIRVKVYHADIGHKDTDAEKDNSEVVRIAKYVTTVVARRNLPDSATTA